MVRTGASCKNPEYQGRNITDYQSNCSFEFYLQNKYNIPDSRSYRSFLQRHGNELMNEFRNKALKANVTGCNCGYSHGYNHAPHNINNNTVLPYNPNDTEYIMKYHVGQETPIASAPSQWLCHQKQNYNLL